MRRQLFIAFGVYLVYVAAALLGFRAAFLAEQVTTVWAPTGIAQAALLLRGVRLWPAVWLGAFTANALTSAPLWTAPLIATGNALEAVLAAAILRRLEFDPALRRTRDCVAFILAAAVLAPVVSATIGVSTLTVAAPAEQGRVVDLWWAWWLGDSLGALVVGTTILVVARPSTGLTARTAVEISALVAAGALATHLAFGELLGRASAYPSLEYVIFPFVIAAAVRRRQPATALVVLASAVVAVWHTLNGFGPFSSADIHRSLVLLKVFMAVVACTGILLAAAISERETSERRRAAAHAVGDVLTRSPSLADASPPILHALCDRLDWAAAVMWMADERGEHLESVATYARLVPDDSPFLQVTRATRLTRGVGLPGRVWASGRASWIHDVIDDRNFPRAAAARASGVYSAFAFPVPVAGQVRGVIECFNRTVLSTDSALLETMMSVGAQIGQFITRKEVDAARQRAERERDDLLERELAARRDAETANRAKDDFLATLSHELRTPLNAIIGWTRMLLDGSLDEESRRRALEVIDRNAKLQAALVADILDVSHIITGGLRLERRPVDLGTVINSALDAVRPAAEAKGIRIHTRIGTGARLAEGDPQRLQQIVWNLLANAVKFAPAAGDVEVSLEADVSDAGLRLIVRDNGIGIDPEFLPHVFDRFRQGDGSVSRQHGGLGLGLAIVRHLVELHGGRVRALSDGANRGATFIVELPPAEAPSCAV